MKTYVCGDCKKGARKVPCEISIFISGSVLPPDNGQTDPMYRDCKVTGVGHDLKHIGTVCPSCNQSTTLDKWKIDYICDNCGIIPVKEDQDFCNYNGSYYCEECYDAIRSTCNRCNVAARCELNKSHIKRKDAHKKLTTLTNAGKFKNNN